MALPYVVSGVVLFPTQEVAMRILIGLLSIVVSVCVLSLLSGMALVQPG